MKQLTNAKTIPAGIVLPSLVAGGAAAAGEWAWAAVILGLAAPGFSATLRQPKLAPVRIRSQKRRY